jgi:undecaprenyl-diphosphatase
VPRIRTWIVIAGVAAVVFGALAVTTLQGDTGAFNTWIEDGVYAGRSAPLTVVFRGFTAIGEWYGLVPIAVILLIVRHSRRAAIPAAIALFVSAGLNLALKAAFTIPRPTGDRLIEESGWSVPSGHAQDSAALFFTLAFCALAGSTTATHRRLLVVVAVLITLGIGASRVYLGVHSPVDVLAGFAVGLAVAATTTAIVAAATRRTEPAPAPSQEP